MTLYLRERRKCKDCEYYHKKSHYSSSTCQYNPPVAMGENQRGRFPTTSDNDYCSKWEPIWHKNPLIREAWNEFILVRKLITSGEEKS